MSLYILQIPELRVKMLRNPNADKALENLQWF